MSQPQTAKCQPNNLYPVDLLDSFKSNLLRHGLNLTRGKCTTLQINVGLLCNQTCKHCHLDAGPSRQEIMAEKTVAEVIALAERFSFETIDITGGAPEMNPHITRLVKRLAPLANEIILRSNLTAIAAENRLTLLQLLADQKVTITASLPSLNEAQSDAQRGKNSFDLSLKTLKKLNLLGYGRAGTGLKLNLVSNPTGAFLPASQAETESRFRRLLFQKWDISFNNLYTFANMPLGRYLFWLQKSGNLESYLHKLASNFNPCTIDGLMCRSLISVSWDGYLFDCDFNQSLQLFMGGRKQHISELTDLPVPGDPIAVSEHCYTCTAGSGFT